MYFGHDETMRWCRQVARIARKHPAIVDRAVELVILPSTPGLLAAHEVFDGTLVRIGAQNLFWEDQGAYTGETSGNYLKQVGCDFVVIGHAERRRIFAENDQIIASKTAAAVRNSLTPIICVGDPEHTSAHDAAQLCIAQVKSALASTVHERDGREVVVAYEPEWAIGAEKPAPTTHIASVCAEIKDWMSVTVGFDKSRLIYGGSAGPGLLDELSPYVDGLFLGRFVHDAAALERILDEIIERAE